MGAWCEETLAVHSSGGTSGNEIAPHSRKGPQGAGIQVHISKPGSAKERPLEIPCFEDKLIQAGLVRMLESVYEQDFINDLYGFRPARSCHGALKAFSLTMERKSINHLVEADIKGFFDNVNQEWLLKFLAHRIGDKRIQRMVKRILKAGVAEGGSVTISDDGTPQCAGVLADLPSRVLRKRGNRAEAFDFLGLTHSCGTRRNGTGFRMKRVTARKKFGAKLRIFKEWLKEARTLKTKELWKAVSSNLRGHYNYYGVTDNYRGLIRFDQAVKKLLFKWLNRRRKRSCLNWEEFNKILKRFPLPKPRITVSMYVCSDYLRIPCEEPCA